MPVFTNTPEIGCNVPRFGLVITLSVAVTLYSHLVPVANDWNEAMGIDLRYLKNHADFVERCHHAGQVRPTPLLLQYGAGDITRESIKVPLDRLIKGLGGQPPTINFGTAGLQRSAMTRSGRV